MTAPRFAFARPAEDPVVRVVRRGLLALLVPIVVLAALSGWRAWVQVRSLDVQLDSAALRPGSTIRAALVSTGRTTVDVRVELVQGARVQPLAELRVPGNRDGALDPRFRSRALRVVLTLELLARFDAGPAVVRATAVGRSQWLRVPTPTVRERRVRVAETAPPPSSRRRARPGRDAR